MSEKQPVAEDLCEHLAYHAGIGFAECRDMDPPADEEPAVSSDLVREHPTYSFAVVHGGITYRVTVEQQ